MSDMTVKKVDELACYEGEHMVPGIKFRYAGEGLGVKSLGMNVLEMEPNVDRYPEHNHAKDGEEEVYILLQGSATLKAGDEEWQLEPGMLVRAGASATRKFVAGPQGAVLVALSNVPG